jgi:hypothetical protein
MYWAALTNQRVMILFGKLYNVSSELGTITSLVPLQCHRDTNTPTAVAMQETYVRSGWSVMKLKPESKEESEVQRITGIFQTMTLTVG